MNLNFIDGIIVGMVLAWVFEAIGFRIARCFAARGGEQE